MNRDSVLRTALWATAPANVGVGILVLFPGSMLGQLVGLPQPAPQAVYGYLLALLLSLFGGMYAWIASQPTIQRPFVTFAAIGKSTAFVVVFVLWLADAAPGRFTFLMSGDLLFASVFVWWLRGEVDVART